MSNQQVQSGGIGFAGLLTILFIGLKLTGNITWSWWWVLSPLWLPITVILAIIGIGLFCVYSWDVYENWKKEKRILQKKKNR
jgi:hypothetical protein